MRSVLVRYWFLLGLLFLIPCGLAVGFQFDSSDIESWQSRIQPRFMTAAILLLMAFTLDSRQFLKSLETPGPVLLAGTINLGLIQLLACFLVSLQQSADFQCGLMIAASVPCTLAAASVWTRKAGGNDAISLLVTLTTNSLCVLITPFWLMRGTSQNVEFDLGEMTWRLVLVVLVPTLVGQIARLLPAMTNFATRRKIQIGVLAQGLILLLVFTAAMKAGDQLRSAPGSIGLTGLLLVSVCCIGLHLIGAAAAWWSSGLMKFSLFDRKAVIFAASQKTLPIGVLLATDPTMFGAAGVPFAIFPMLIYHASQLLIDTSLAQRLVKIENEPED